MSDDNEPLAVATTMRRARPLARPHAVPQAAPHVRARARHGRTTSLRHITWNPPHLTPPDPT
eukprot:3370837-Prymnesium_polylepis.3